MEDYLKIRPVRPYFDDLYDCKNNECHIDDDRSVIKLPCGSQYWYKHSKRHRDDDQPAIIQIEWGYTAGNINVKKDNIHQEWYQNGLLHRDGDQPAIIESDGMQYWYQNGRLHRDGDKPACTYLDGTQLWYQNGCLHRDGGKPAVINSNGEQKWYTYNRLDKSENNHGITPIWNSDLVISTPKEYSTVI